MATTATINLSSDIMATYSGYRKQMTMTKAGTLNDLEETTGFSRVKLSGTPGTGTDFIRMATELVNTTATITAAKVYVKNLGPVVTNGTASRTSEAAAKSNFVTIQIGNIGTAVQEIGRLYAGDWLLMPVTAADDVDVIAIAETDDAVVLEYVMFYE